MFIVRSKKNKIVLMNNYNPYLLADLITKCKVIIHLIVSHRVDRFKRQLTYIQTAHPKDFFVKPKIDA